MIVMLDHEKEDITTNSSPIRLIVGGRAKLVRLAKSHQVAISGSIIILKSYTIMEYQVKNGELDVINIKMVV